METGESTTTDADDSESEYELPADVVEEAERLTRLAREAVDPSEAAAYRERREALVGEHDFTPRVREDDTSETLVLYPSEWVEDGTVQIDRIEDTDRAVEISLSGPGAPDEWQEVDDYNRDLVAQIRDVHGEVHAGNAEKLADFMGNHYARPMDTATAAELREFKNWYYPRNAWPSEEEQAVVDESLRLVFETAEKRVPDL
ncbi:DUF7108 domain-containing protein [Haloarchaeobius sp. TZWWS8]|uniref:DUF7108 domain-containing protein n=1 Tax=Haloarchaeobius sp. TZWWS8 TaxID=3446121 RepID=UPI003EB78F25